MSEAWIGVIGSVIVAALSLIGVIISNRANTRDMLAQIKSHSDASDAKLEKAQAVTDTKIQILTDEVRKHNNFAEKIPVLEEKIAVANHRISDLEHQKGA